MDQSAADPPLFLRLAAHPVRWRILRELVRSDRTVAELTSLVDEPQSLVSYHLRLLRDASLVSAHRSSADRRDTYYSIDLVACRDELLATGRALHTALLGPGERPVSEPAGGSHGRRVLFLCTGNSARSQIAEALLGRMSEGTIETASAGSQPKPLHPHAVRVLARRGIDISGNTSKHVDQFVSQRFDEVITLCDRVRRVCPPFPTQPELVHWSVPDPALIVTSSRASHAAFERTADELETRIGFRFHLPAVPTPTRRSSHADR